LDEVIGPGQYLTGFFGYKGRFHEVSFLVGSLLSFHEIFEPETLPSDNGCIIWRGIDNLSQCINTSDRCYCL